MSEEKKEEVHDLDETIDGFQFCKEHVAPEALLQLLRDVVCETPKNDVLKAIEDNYDELLKFVQSVFRS